MGAVKELYIHREPRIQTIRRLSDIRTKLQEADAFADIVRDKALRDYSSDEPYQNACALSGRILTALSMVEIMIDDLEAGR